MLRKFLFPYWMPLIYKNIHFSPLWKKEQHFILYFTSYLESINRLFVHFPALLYPLSVFLFLLCACVSFSSCPLSLNTFSDPYLPLPLSVRSSSQLIDVSVLVLVKDVATAAKLFPHVGHFLAECSVLPLQKGSAHRDLVLFHSSCVSRTLSSLVVLQAPTPIFLILDTQWQKRRKAEKQKIIPLFIHSRIQISGKNTKHSQHYKHSLIWGTFLRFSVWWLENWVLRIKQAFPIGIKKKKALYIYLCIYVFIFLPMSQVVQNRGGQK